MNSSYLELLLARPWGCRRLRTQNSSLFKSTLMVRDIPNGHPSISKRHLEPFRYIWLSLGHWNLCHRNARWHPRLQTMRRDFLHKANESVHDELYEVRYFLAWDFRFISANDPRILNMPHFRQYPPFMLHSISAVDQSLRPLACHRQICSQVWIILF